MRLWTRPDLVDRRNGGFRNAVDAAGKPLPQKTKPLLAHLRMLYVYAVAIQRAQTAKRRGRLRAVFEEEFGFLTQHFWDKKGGGWYFNLDSRGRPKGRDKRTLGQTYAVYVLAEIARILDDSPARRWALKTFHCIDRGGHDARYGGYLNDWTLPPDSTANAGKDPALNFHTLLGLAALVRATGERAARQRALELLGIIPRHFLYDPSGNGWLRLNSDWSAPHLPPTAHDLTLYGHDAELGWYTLEAEEDLGRPAGERLAWVRRVADAVIRNGFSASGALHVRGRLDDGPTDHEVHFWCQTEALVLLARLAAATGDVRYWRWFQKTARWTFTHVAQPGVRPWRLIVTDTGRPVSGGFAGAEWRAGFHVTRMILETTRALRAYSPE